LQVSTPQQRDAQHLAKHTHAAAGAARATTARGEAGRGPSPEQAQETMDKYHIFNEIGAGKNSQVFKGRQKKTVTYVAVKRVAKDQMSKVVNEVRSRRPAVLRRLHAIDATRVHQTRSWVVYFLILRPFGPRRETAMLRAGPDDARPAAPPRAEVLRLVRDAE